VVCDILPNFTKLRPSLPNEAGGMAGALTQDLAR
jgi:hypothetical protein